MGDASEVVQTASQDFLGIVLAVQANYYWVRLDTSCSAPYSGQASSEQSYSDQASSEPKEVTLLCTRRTRLKKMGQQVAVGDRVQVEEIDWTDGRAAISQVLPRGTELDRPPIANVDQILLVFALEEPTIDPFQLSRFLVKAESTEIPVLLCLNKGDLITAAARQQWRDRLQAWGYDPVIVSLRESMGLDLLYSHLSDRITVVCGPSGVGKSSLTNYLIPDLAQRVNTVSGKLSRGRHTTRHVELFQLPLGGLIADTPGFNQPDLNCAPVDLAQYFPEARQRLDAASCQFSNCLHRDEPNCVVRGDWERYEYYLTFLEEAIVYQTAIDRSGDAESTTKAKNRGEGLVQTEPMLDRKKYRRPSRRTTKQDLRALYRDVNESATDSD
ncbi:MAG: small ribosomal subunit biogenesis GTPase RsgA [Drouetiella hepatica Uher 2000/2452]|uniref:Small ribosomal subunit biogenesis GTPase RsgA n=1 Tax=Drouetiella hepatica Uher 2000/2452 TaxID=904376 RepID=A0A951Q7Q0_9CYAN|nr:small ribosomal subunit biogenesis GTPase RsgA [Drouetiella hepatica Uher 2000/2452]